MNPRKLEKALANSARQEAKDRQALLEAAEAQRISEKQRRAISVSLTPAPCSPDGYMKKTPDYSGDPEERRLEGWNPLINEQ